MPIFHLSIAKAKARPFFEYSHKNHNLQPLLRSLLKKLSDKNEIKSFKDEEFIINIKNFDSLILACITTPEFLVEKSIAFLEEIEAFYLKNQNGDDLLFFAKERVNYYNSEQCMTKNELIVKNLIETKDIIFEDVSKVLERENKLNEIYQKTEKMAQGFNETNSFKQQLIQKKRNEEIRVNINRYYKKRKGLIFIVSGVIIMMIIYFFISYFCGFDISFYI